MNFYKLPAALVLKNNFSGTTLVAMANIYIWIDVAGDGSFWFQLYWGC
jgi:hypothetical protein